MLPRLLNCIKCTFFVLIILSCLSPISSAEPLATELIQLPVGFKIEVYAENISNARSMALSPHGTLFVGSRTAGRVYALVDDNNDHKADRVYIIAEGLNMPNGVAFRHGSLYVAEIHRVIRFDRIEEQLNDPPDHIVVNDALPDEKWHGWKFIKFGPDGKLYVPIGAPCNVCEHRDSLFSTIVRMDFEGNNLEIYAKGIRNSVGFDWHPQTNELWFTDNGRDMMGDDIPPDELNHAPQEGMHFGFPYCHGNNISDPKFGNKHSCQEFNAPAQELGPHVASLGMQFYEGGMFPEKYHHQIFIAEHGSWNRSKKIGYRVMLVSLEGSRAVSYEVFAEGWKQGEKAWGRPVDLELMPDGSLLVSDDYGDAIYRITYEKP